MIAICLALTAGASHAALTVVGDYDFSGNQTPAEFSEFGSPTYANGKLLLNGSTYIQAPSPLADSVSDNFVLEVIANANSFGGFNFVTSISPASGANFGFGVLAAGGEWSALTSSSAFVGSTPHGGGPTSTVALAYVFANGDASLYVNGARFDSGAGNTFNLTYPAVLTIGAHPFDAPNGLFNGEIDRVRVSTFSGTFNAGDLLGPGDGTTIPEPGALLLLALGGVFGLRRRK